MPANLWWSLAQCGGAIRTVLAYCFILGGMSHFVRTSPVAKPTSSTRIAAHQRANPAGVLHRFLSRIFSKGDASQWVLEGGKPATPTQRRLVTQ